MGEKQIFTNGVTIEFDSAQAFAAILAAITVEVGKDLEGTQHPSEVVKLARNVLIDVFSSIVEGMSQKEITTHLEAMLIVKTPLLNLTKPEFRQCVEPVIH